MRPALLISNTYSCSLGNMYLHTVPTVCIIVLFSYGLLFLKRSNRLGTFFICCFSKTWRVLDSRIRFGASKFSPKHCGKNNVFFGALTGLSMVRYVIRHGTYPPVSFRRGTFSTITWISIIFVKCYRVLSSLQFPHGDHSAGEVLVSGKA